MKARLRATMVVEITYEVETHHYVDAKTVDDMIEADQENLTAEAILDILTSCNGTVNIMVEKA